MQFSALIVIIIKVKGIQLVNMFNLVSANEGKILFKKTIDHTL